MGSGGATPSALQASSSSTSLLSRPSSSTAVKHGPCFLTEQKDPGFRYQVPEKTSLHLLFGAQGYDWVWTKITGSSSGNCQETETSLVRACHMPRQPLQNHVSGLLGG